LSARRAGFAILAETAIPQIPQHRNTATSKCRNTALTLMLSVRRRPPLHDKITQSPHNNCKENFTFLTGVL
jgi:hypothetical protein